MRRIMGKRFFLAISIVCFLLGILFLLGSIGTETLMATQDICINCVFAEDVTNKELLNTIETMERLLKGIYLVLWPLLAIAGAALDNSLVYGEIFFLDTMLWKFRQVIRNFVNFAIGLMFVGSILASFFYQNSEKFNLATILKNTFIAGILVQMSWFIVAVLIDLSTVGVVGLGALPLTVLEEGNVQVEGPSGNPNNTGHVLSNVKFFKTHTIFNLDGSKEAERDFAEHAIVYSCGQGSVSEGSSELHYLPCRIDQGKFIKKGNADGTEPLSRVAYRNALLHAWRPVGYTTHSVSDSYCVYGNDLLRMEGNWGLADTPENVKKMRNEAEAQNAMAECSTLDEYITKAHGLTGPLYLLFAVVMDMSEIAVTSNTVGLGEAMFQFLMKLLVGVGLLIPLLVTAIVLIIRAVILRLIIAFSPLLVLLFLYGKESEKAQIGAGNITNVSDVLTLIFFPVFVVFAISMSLVFLTLISRVDFINDDNTCENDPLSLMGCTLDKATCETGSARNYECFGVEFTLTANESKTGADAVNTMGWLVKNFLGIALMWAIIFFALKSNKMTRGLVEGIEGLGKSLAMSVPIVPTNNGWMQVGALKSAMRKVEGIPKQIETAQYNSSPMKGWIDDLEGNMLGVTKEKEEALTKSIGNKAVATKQITAGAADNTTAGNYASLPPALASAAGLKNPEMFSKLEDVLNRPETIAFLAAQDGGLDQFMKDWHKEQGQHEGGYKSKERDEHYNAAEEGARNGGLGLGKINDLETYRVNKNGMITAIGFNKDEHGRIVDSVSYHLTGAGKTKEDIETINEMLVKYGSAHAVDEVLGNDMGTSLVNAALVEDNKNPHENGESIYTTEDGKVSYKVTIAKDADGKPQAIAITDVTGPDTETPATDKPESDEPPKTDEQVEAPEGETNNIDTQSVDNGSSEIDAGGDSTKDTTIAENTVSQTNEEGESIAEYTAPKDPTKLAEEAKEKAKKEPKKEPKKEVNDQTPEDSQGGNNDKPK